MALHSIPYKREDCRIELGYRYILRTDLDLETFVHNKEGNSDFVYLGKNGGISWVEISE